MKCQSFSPFPHILLTNHETHICLGDTLILISLFQRNIYASVSRNYGVGSIKKILHFLKSASRVLTIHRVWGILSHSILEYTLIWVYLCDRSSKFLGLLGINNFFNKLLYSVSLRHKMTTHTSYTNPEIIWYKLNGVIKIILL